MVENRIFHSSNYFMRFRFGKPLSLMVRYFFIKCYKGNT